MFNNLPQTLKTNRQVQFALTVVVLGTLLILNFWQKQAAVTSQNQTHPLPAKLSFALPAQVRANEAFTVTVKVDTKGRFANTVTANFYYPSELLEYQTMSVENSFIKLWAEKKELDGQILLTGALPQPGFKGHGDFAEITFKPLQEGTARLRFADSAVIYEDQTSHNILGGTQESELLIIP